MPTQLLQTTIVIAATALLGTLANAADWPNGANELIVRGGMGALTPVTVGEHLRITASGNVAYDLASPVCASVDPRGCQDPDSLEARPISNAPPAALIGTFVDQRGIPVALSFAPGEAADVLVPLGAHQLVLSINLEAGQVSQGEFTVAALPTVVRPRALTIAPLTERTKAQHLLRRFGFSASPELITSIAREGVDNWFVKQLSPAFINDSYATTKIERLPTTTDSTGSYIDFDVWERRLIQRELLTNRQVLEKMVLHWLDHFSVGNEKVDDPAQMSEYEAVVRANALGNFATLASDVARTPAMLNWLDNNLNDGSDPVNNPPNENFARELMQLFTIGPYQLNIDGSIKVNAQGVPIPSFSESDVKSVARGLTGFYVAYASQLPYSNPETRFGTRFAPWWHAPGPETILGKIVSVPDSPACAYSVISSLTAYSSSAPFLAKELLQRVALENPSPRYIAEIANVWQQNEYAKNQIALVIEAIERDPEFYAADYHSMPKEPVELFAQFSRDVPVILKVSQRNPGSTGPGESLIWDLRLVLQEPYDPPSVFSFYLPGNKEVLVSQVALLDRFNSIGDITGIGSTAPGADTALDLPELRSRIGPKNSDPATVEAYLLDAMVDSSSTVLAGTVKAYLGTVAVDDEHLAGAVWLIATSPEFEVN